MNSDAVELNRSFDVSANFGACDSNADNNGSCPVNGWIAGEFGSRQYIAVLIIDNDEPVSTSASAILTP